MLISGSNEPSADEDYRYFSKRFKNFRIHYTSTILKIVEEQRVLVTQIITIRHKSIRIFFLFDNTTDFYFFLSYVLLPNSVIVALKLLRILSWVIFSILSTQKSLNHLEKNINILHQYLAFIWSFISIYRRNYWHQIELP